MLALIACGPAARNPAGGDDTAVDAGHNGDAPQMACVGSGVPEICNDGIDNDCDGLIDCADPDCSGKDGCPVCGMVNDPEATPIDLPDGISSGNSCSTDAQCPAATPNCIVCPDTDVGVIKECHASYTSTLNFVGFPTGATLTDTTKLLNVCIDIEHSYLHDLQIEVLSPPDSTGNRYKVSVQQFAGRIGPKIYVGHPIEDDDAQVIPGVTQHYCFVPGSATDMYDANFDQYTATPADYAGPQDHVPPGNYSPMEPFKQLMGAPLNGTWTMRVTDMYAIDNGTLGGWSITFDPSLVTSCTGPIVE